MTALEKLTLGLIASGKPYTSYMGLRYTLENGVGLIMGPDLLHNLEALGTLIVDKGSASHIVTTKGRQIAREIDFDGVKEELAPEAANASFLAKITDILKEKVQAN